MLEFDRCLLRERPGREPERAVPRRVFASQPNAKFKYGGVVLAWKYGVADARSLVTHMLLCPQAKHMALTRNFKQTVVRRVAREPAFAKALLDEAATLFLRDEPETARLILRDLVNATLGFEELSRLTDKPIKSLHRMLSPNGNPSMDNLAAIFGAMRASLKVVLEVHAKEKA